MKHTDIEEIVERYLELLVIKKTKNPVSHQWLRDTLTTLTDKVREEAHQAGIDEAVGVWEGVVSWVDTNKRQRVGLGVIYDVVSAPDLKEVLTTALEQLKALQDNK